MTPFTVSKIALVASLALCACLTSCAAYMPVKVSPIRNVQRPISLTYSPAVGQGQAKKLSPLFSDATSSADNEDLTPASDESEKKVAASDESEKKSAFGRFGSRFMPKSSENLSSKEMLAKMGLSVLLSYGWVSNMNYSISVSLAWFGFTKKTGLSPLAPGQWKPFLLVYSGFYIFNNTIQPLRIATAVGISKYFDMVINTVQEKTRLSRGWAIGITVFLINIVGTFALMASGISLAAALSGVPVFAPKP